ncbi:MAG: hypothetical protein HY043_13070 [Verrucomicrobia bacterium]|nr:hypothetical protein [Verrucomicrobiota bacterium]
MATEPVITNLRTKLATISAGTEQQFLDSFKTIHNTWHMAEMMSGAGTFGGKPIGFLSFHHEVISVYIAKFKPGLAPGPMAKTSPPYKKVTDLAPDAQQFSNTIEGWHGRVHNNAAKYGPDFADPKKNIYMPRFWQFHKFIDNKFQSWLAAHQQSYGDVDHTVV